MIPLVEHVRAELRGIFPDFEQRFYTLGESRMPSWVPEHIRPDDLADFRARYHDDSTSDDRAAAAICVAVLSELVAIAMLLRDTPAEDVRAKLEDVELAPVHDDEYSDEFDEMVGGEYAQAAQIWETIAEATRQSGGRIGFVTIPADICARPFVRTMDAVEYAQLTSQQIHMRRGFSSSGLAENSRILAIISTVTVAFFSLGRCFS